MSPDPKLNHYPAVLFLGFMLLGLVTGESTQAQIQNGQFGAPYCLGLGIVLKVSENSRL